MYNIDENTRVIRLANGFGVRSQLVELYNNVKWDPELLAHVTDFKSVGYSFSYMLKPALSDDVDILQRISSIAYLFLSLALESNPNDVEVRKQRIRTMAWAWDSFGYTAMSGDVISRFARPEDYTAKMIISDISCIPGLEQDVEFRGYWVNAGSRFGNRFTGETCNYISVAENGKKLHEKIFDLLRHQIIDESDIDF